MSKSKVEERQAVAEEPRPEVSRSRDGEVERAVVSKAFPHVHGLDRRIAWLFDHGESRFFRVNFHDSDHENFICRSHFVEVTGGEAKEWPNPPRKPSGFLLKEEKNES